MTQEHIVKAYDAELTRLSELISRMGEMAEKQIGRAITALSERDAELASQVVADDLEIDGLEAEIHEFTVRLLALRQPMARDLRQIVAALRIAPDLERIGDYAKNVYDLVKYGADFENAPDRKELSAYRDRVSHLIGEAAEAFAARDTEHAQRLINKADRFLDDYDAQVKAAYRWEGTASDAVSRALYFRFLKRITAHVMNFLTSLVMPVDRLDSYDEAKQDR